MKTGQKIGIGIAAVSGVIFVAMLWLPLFNDPPYGSVEWAGLPRILLVLLHWGSGWASQAWKDIWVAAIECGAVAAIGGVVYWLSGASTPPIAAGSPTARPDRAYVTTWRSLA